MTDIPRSFVAVKPGYLVNLYASAPLEIQGQTLVDPFLDKWMRVSGLIESIGGWRVSGSLVVLAIDDKDVKLYAHFTDVKWRDRLSVSQQSDYITIIGRIFSVAARWVELNDCELE